MSAHWSWIWPSVGGTPINQGLDSEMFDRVDYPYTETFVREAIQNSLDARRDMNSPVVIRFAFHEGRLGKRKKFLDEAITHRKNATLAVPSDWSNERIKWITVEDSNTRGLLGDLEDRKGDFWGYWLNFGVSNKSGTGRGGRGIGRVTFLIASTMHTVIGITRRSSDHAVAACGMCVLKADQYGDEFKSTHCYLAEKEHGAIYDLHASDGFHSQLEEAFELSPYTPDMDKTGLSLIIPYPHDELTEEGILAAAIDHFSPAILNGSLVVEVGIDRLDTDTIKDVAPCVASSVKSRPVAEDVDRYLRLIEAGLTATPTEIALSGTKPRFAEVRDTEAATALRTAVSDGEQVAFRISFPIRKEGVTTTVGLTAVVAPKPYGKLPLDRLFREGMSLPDVKARRPADLDLILLVDEDPLAQYLNFCEGKAHLDLLESKEVRSKLDEAGFEDGLSIKRLVKSLPDELRNLLTEESDEPDTSVWEGFFSIPNPEGEKKKAQKQRKNDPDPPPPPPPSPVPVANVSAVLVDTLSDGFRLRANPAYTKFPASVDVVIAYADGSGKPSWSAFDFTAKDLQTATQDCTTDFTDNRLRIGAWTSQSVAEVTGFDPRRELDTRIRTVSNASED